MIKDRKIYGIDISKSVFGIYSKSTGHFQLPNDSKGFKILLKKLPKEALVVMEATGYYHYRLAQFLDKNEVAVSVVNPLLIKRSIQMRLAKVKTDNSDSKYICEYGTVNEVPFYNALTDVQSECLQLFRLLDSYVKSVQQKKQPTWRKNLRYSIKNSL